MIFKFFKFLESKEISYTLLNGYEEICSNLKSDSDIDILFKKSDFSNIEVIIQSFCNQSNYKMVQIYHQEIWAKNIFLFDANSGQFLNLDIYGQLARKEVVLFNELAIFESIGNYKHIPILVSHQEFVYYLSKKLDKKDLSIENFKHLRELYLKSPKECNQALIEYFPNVHKIISSAFLKEVYEDIINNNELLFKDFLRRKSIGIKSLIKDKVRIVQRILNPTGIAISFLGPDGSGKSTIINTLVNQQLPFRRNDYFHLKPQFSKTRKTSIVTNPHEKALYSTINSYIKILYFIAQYNWGWIRNIKMLKIKSSLIIFDRYFDDILADPKRYRYGGVVAIAKLARKFIPKPDIYFILTTDAKTIYKRKKEVPFKELEQQILAYKNLADNKRYFNVDVNRTPNEITNEVIGILMKKMQERY